MPSNKRKEKWSEDAEEQLTGIKINNAYLFLLIQIKKKSYACSSCTGSFDSCYSATNSPSSIWVSTCSSNSTIASLPLWSRQKSQQSVFGYGLVIPSRYRVQDILFLRRKVLIVEGYISLIRKKKTNIPKIQGNFNKSQRNTPPPHPGQASNSGNRRYSSVV